MFVHVWLQIQSLAHDDGMTVWKHDKAMNLEGRNNKQMSCNCKFKCKVVIIIAGGN